MKSSTFAASGIWFHLPLLPCLTFLYLNNNLSGTLWVKEVGSNKKNKKTGSKTGSLHIWLKESGDFPLPSGDTCLVIPAEGYRLGQNTSGFRSLYLGQSECWCSIKRKSLAPDLVHTALTGSGWHLRNVKVISWIGLNEKLMDFKGERELISALLHHGKWC